MTGAGNRENQIIRAIDARRLLAQLPAEQLVMVILRNAFGCTFREIARLGWLGSSSTCARIYRVASENLLKLVCSPSGPQPGTVATIHAVADTAAVAETAAKTKRRGRKR